MKLTSIQSKIGGTIVVILLVTLGCSFTFTTWQSRNQLQQQQKQALDAIHETSLLQARSIFASLQIGSSASLEQGEMDAFNELLLGLGNVPGVLEVGLTDPNGTINFSSHKGKLKQNQADLKLTGSADVSVENEFEDRVFMAHGHVFEKRCLECHDGAKTGELAGVLYVDYSLQNLVSEKKRQEGALADANSASLRSNLVIALLTMLLIYAALFILLRKLVTTPLSGVNKVLQQIAQGHISERLNLSQQDEIGDTARILDNFANSLEKDVVGSLEKLAHGDLTFKVTPHDANDKLRHALQKLGSDLTVMISEIQDAGGQINAGSSQVSDAAQSLSQGATESAASLEQISSSMAVIGNQTSQSAANATQANKLATEAYQAAGQGNQQMGAMVQAMGEINSAGQNISKIIKVIDEIAFQTNLLALNAAVEAARAGQHGKGFAVVAEEVRNLAGRSAKAARETAELIESSVEKTARGTEIAEKTSTALEEIVVSITKVTDLIGEIATASNEQAQGISQINIGLQQIDQVIQQSTASAEECAATSEELASQSNQMQQMLSRFKLANSSHSVSQKMLR
jgi:methyl-accepting chemotaxis protein